MREVRWERMFPDELEEAFARNPTMYFAYGLCEPHGPHNALGLDALKAHGICCEAAREHGGIVAPPDYWHINELGEYGSWADRNVGQVPRTWLTCMPPWQHFKNVCYHIRQAEVLGFRAAIHLTGHYGPNFLDLYTLSELIQPFVRMRLCGIPDFVANQPGFDSDGKSSGDHAGKVETSLLWSLEPDCVDMSRLPLAAAPPPHFAIGANAAQSNRKVGERMAADEVRWLGEKSRELLAQYDPAIPAKPLHSFEDVEQFWDQTIRPRFKDFKTMIELPEGQTPPSRDSMWRANWKIPDRS
jgi:creatinine amidohydrolase